MFQTWAVHSATQVYLEVCPLPLILLAQPVPHLGVVELGSKRSENNFHFMWTFLTGMFSLLLPSPFLFSFLPFFFLPLPLPSFFPSFLHFLPSFPSFLPSFFPFSFVIPFFFLFLYLIPLPLPSFKEEDDFKGIIYIFKTLHHLILLAVNNTMVN